MRHSSDGRWPTNYNVTNDFKYSDAYTPIVDTGTFMTTLPPALASHVMTAYNPPARLQIVDDDPDTYYVPCDAQPPFLGVQFTKNDTAGVMWFDDKDMIMQDTATTVNGKSYCQPGVQSAGTDTPILGDTWLHTVLAVFDVGKDTMHFGQRSPY